jgi:hypothetical protein
VLSVSVNGGREPIWSSDESTLFYRGPNRMMAATIAERRPAVTNQDSLFVDIYRRYAPHSAYDVFPNGREWAARVFTRGRGGHIWGLPDRMSPQTARFLERPMLDSIAQALAQIGSFTLWTCMAGLVAIDALAVAAVVQTRSRNLVNRWTGRILAANVLLLGTGIGVPLTAYLARSVVLAVAPSVEPMVTQARESAVSRPK